MRSLIGDLRFAVRLIGKRPLTSGIIVLTLALGIGANTAMFAGFDAWVLRPLPFAEPERLVTLWQSRPSVGENRYAIAPANLNDWRIQSRTLAAIEPYERRVFNFHLEDEPDRVAGARVAAGLFPLLGIDPVAGRHFLAAEDRPDGPAVALISHQLWQRRFAADPGVLGRTVRLDGRTHEIVGVMPPGFEFPEWAHVWAPLALDVHSAERGERRLSAVARLAPGRTLEQARSDMGQITDRLAARYPDTNAGWSVEVQPLRQQWSPPVIHLALWSSIIAAGFVLLIICANVANLMLAQSSGRVREMALRTALGASRARLARQTLTESLVLALAGGALGAVVGSWWVDWMSSWAPIDPPYLFRFTVDGRALVYTLLAALAAGLACALAPVVRSSAIGLSETLKSGGAVVGVSGKPRLRGLLVVGEFAVSMLLVVGALLMVKSFLREQAIEPGYRTEDVLTLRLALAGDAYTEPARRVAFLERTLERLAGLGGVAAAGAANHLPASPSGYREARLEAEGRPRALGEEHRAALVSISRGYLESLEIPVVEGRGFTTGEIGATAPDGGVALVSHSLARRLWPQGSALGRRLRDTGDAENPWLTVVGVVTDVNPGHSMTSGEWPRAQIYVPYGQEPSRFVTLALRGAGDAGVSLPAVRAVLKAEGPGVPVSDVQTLSQAIDKVHWVTRMFSKLFSLYALIALAIAALGAYGVTADAVSRRVREMGVRTALGARPADLLRMVLAQGTVLAGIGVLLGLVVAIPATRLLAAMLYEVSASDPVVFAGVALLLVAVAAAAAYLPAQRAARVDPIEVLRFE